MSAAHADRNQYLAYPDFTDVPVAMLTSAERATEWAEKIKAGEFLGDGQEEPPSCTTHISIADQAGNAVSCTHTLGTGSGVVTPGMGFVYNNSMKLFDPYPGSSTSIEAGKARTTGMVPTMLFRDGKPAIVVGAPGESSCSAEVVNGTGPCPSDHDCSPAGAAGWPGESRRKCRSGSGLTWSIASLCFGVTGTSSGELYVELSLIHISEPTRPY